MRHLAKTMVLVSLVNTHTLVNALTGTLAKTANSMSMSALRAHVKMVGTAPMKSIHTRALVILDLRVHIVKSILTSV